MLLSRQQRIAPFPAVLLLLLGSELRADLGPPVKLTMPKESPMAVAGQVYKGVWEVRVGRAGAISHFALEGEGWTIQTLDRSLEGTQVKAGVHPIAFTALPTHPNAALKFSLSYEGRRVSRQFRLGGATFALRDSNRQAVQALPGRGAGGPQPQADARTLRFTGRIVYSRPASLNPDDSPIWFGATDEGIDHIFIEVMDEDDITDETIWSGYTDQNGYFDSGAISWDDCDISGCDDPDLYLRWECDTEVVNVQDAEDILEPDYSWSTEDQVIDDFTGNAYDFGTWKPADQGQMAALHIHNSVVRANRFLMDSQKIGVVISGLPEVDVLWPAGDNASYLSDEIKISPRREWNEGTHCHEYGHHLLENTAQNVTPEYCNGFCDTDPTFPEFDCGHCLWCQETDHDAWNEGFPNWLADIITREYPFTYAFSDGSPYEALIPRPLENLGICGQDNQSHSPLITEGFLGALLRDIEDSIAFDGSSLQDDHNADGICDCLELGYDEIFTIALIDDVITPAQFITTFISRYPEHTPALYSTAFNVHPDFVTGLFPTDTQPPGVVPYATSPSHPPVVGSTSPCIELHLGAVADDVTGACGFSYEWTTTPAGLEPDMDEVGNYVEASCCIVSPARGLGDHWISLRAKDCAGHWSNEWATFGPFRVTECNSNGILDVCEIPCIDACSGNSGGLCTDTCLGASCANTFPVSCANTCDTAVMADDLDRPVRLACRPSASFCQTLYPGGVCGQGSDCNVNLVPDECDIANGTSRDCNEDGIPDECQNMVSWIAGDGSWHDPQNWDTGQVPQSGQLVCINSPNEDATVTYTAGTTDIWSLSCHENMDFRATSTNHALSIQASSFIRGDLTVGGRNNQIVNANLLTVDGLLRITGDYYLAGGGDIVVRGGMSILGRPTLFNAKDLYVTNNKDAVATSYFTLNSGSAVRVQPGSTYSYDGNSLVVSGGSGLFEIDGAFVRSSGSGTATIQAPIDNAGVIHNLTGNLAVSSGGTHTGHVLSEPGTLLSLVNGAYEWMPGSSLTADDVTLSGGTPGTIRGNVNITGTLTVGNPSGSTVTFTNESNVTSYGENLFARAGTVRFESPASPAVDFDSVTVGEGFIYCGNPYFDTGETFVMNTLHLVCGTINGADPITINDSFIWGGGGSFFSGGAVTCLGPVTIQATSSQRNLSRAFNNTTLATFLGQIAPSGAGRFHNLDTGTVHLQGDNTGLTGGQSTNAGVITKTAGTGRSTLAGMNNTGLIHAQTGEIYFYFGGENNGDILGDPGTLLTFGGTFPMKAGSSLAGDDVTFVGNTFDIRGDVNITGTLTINGGVCTFTSDANVTDYGRRVDALTGTFRFESPVPEPTLAFDAVQIGGGSYSASVHFDTGQPVQLGTLHILNGNVDGDDPITIDDSFTWGPVGSFLPGGAVTCNGSSSVQYSSSSRVMSRPFHNAGYASLLGAIGLSNATCTNEPGGTLDLQSDNGRFSLSSSSTLHNKGVMIKSGGSGISPIHVHFRNAGTLEIRSGQIQFHGSYLLTCIQTAGATILNGGGIDLILNAVYQIQGGDLTGSGTVAGDIANSGGRIVPGLSIGTLTCTGDYTHGTAATLEIELGGLSPGTEHDQFVVGGTARLQGGVANVSPFGGFLPQIGQEFVVLTAGSIEGTFDGVTGPGEYTLTHNPTNVVLTVIASPCSDFASPDFDQDCDVDVDDVMTFVACAAGPADSPQAGCAMSDLDADGDADQADFAVVQRCYSGPGNAADLTCDD